MRRRAQPKLNRWFAAFAATLVLAGGCGGEPPAAAGPQRARIGSLSVTLETVPSPPVSKQDVLFRLQVADGKGEPVTDAGAAVSLSMPGMNHGENAVRLSHREAGVYEGTGIFVMAGRWAVDVTVARRGERATARFLLQVPR